MQRMVGGAGNTASQMAAAVFKWDRLLVGERMSMHFYAEFTAQTTMQKAVERSEVEDATQPAPSAVSGVPPEGKGACLRNQGCVAGSDACMTMNQFYVKQLV